MTKHSNLNLIGRLRFPLLTASITKNECRYIFEPFTTYTGIGTYLQQFLYPQHCRLIYVGPAHVANLINNLRS